MQPDELRRYSRNIALAEIGKAGQQKLLAARVTVIGAGGLGSPALFYLAAAGVGNITIIDNDQVDITNLQRQILFNEKSTGLPKAEEARNTLHDLNSTINISNVKERITAENAGKLLSDSTIVIEGSDNFSTKFLVNDTCVRLGIPVVIGGIAGMEGQILAIRPTDPCYRCVFSEIPEQETSCEFEGILGSVAGVIGSMQATMAMEYITGNESAFGFLHMFDLKNWESRKRKLSVNDSCPNH